MKSYIRNLLGLGSNSLSKTFLNVCFVFLLFLSSVFIGLKISDIDKPLGALQIEQAEETLNTAKAIERDAQGILIGRQEYSIMAGDNSPLKIIRAIIDPANVRVGDTQTLSLIVQSPDHIDRVWAETELDSGKFTLELELVGPAPQELLNSPGVAIDYENGNKLVLIDKLPMQKQFAYNLTRIADAVEDFPMLYRASWVVNDTHNEKYITHFYAKDSSGRIAQTEFTWVDPYYCYIEWNGAGTNTALPKTGDITIATSCTWDTPAGTDGNYTVATTSAVTLDDQWIFTPTKSITINTGGQILFNLSAASIAEGYVCTADSDGDGYNPDHVWFPSQASNCGGAGFVRRSGTNVMLRPGLASAGVSGKDCDDANAGILNTLGTTHIHTPQPSPYEPLSYYEEKAVALNFQEDLNKLSTLKQQKYSSYGLILDCIGNHSAQCTDQCSYPLCDGPVYGLDDYHLRQDGKYGYCTKAAACDYQHYRVLTIDGNPGANTWNALATDANLACIPAHGASAVQPQPCTPNSICASEAMHSHGQCVAGNNLTFVASTCAVASGVDCNGPQYRKCKHSWVSYCNAQGTGCNAAQYTQSYTTCSYGLC